MTISDSVMNVATRINTERMQTQPVEIPIKVKSLFLERTLLIKVSLTLLHQFFFQKKERESV